MSLFTIILYGLPTALAWFIIKKIRNKEQIKFTLLDFFLAFPWTLAAVFLVYSELIAAPGSCGSSQPGSCYSWGILFGVAVVPLCGISGIIIISRIVMMSLKDNRNSRMPPDALK